jgi:ketosteroid isomerase-like protein
LIDGREAAMHPNEKVLRDVDDAQMRGDFDAFLDAFTDDVVVHVPGTSSLAGDHRGKDEFANLFQRFNEAAPDYSFEPHAYLANDEHGVTLQHSYYGRGDEAIDVDDVFVVHFRDRKISELWFISVDAIAVDKFLG